jgi:conjugal transfer pilus assembly protein TraU
VSRLLQTLQGIAAGLLLMTGAAFGQSSPAVCTGAFPNLINDICYDCMFPMTFGGNALSFGVKGEDYDTGIGKSLVCLCAKNLQVGTPIGFWEPRFMVDTTNVPGCMPLLGGVNINPPYNAAEYGGVRRSNSHIGGVQRGAFMHANEYINPVLSAIGAVSESPCLDNRSFDTPFISWADPTWNDDALSMVLTPYAFPFANLASIAAEAPDAIAATFGFPIASLFWVAGSWGPMYPVNGNVSVAVTPEQVSHLLAQGKDSCVKENSPRNGVVRPGCRT